MLDKHDFNQGYGFMQNFSIGSFTVSTYSFFMVLALIAAFLCFKITATKLDKEASRNRSLIVIYALLGGALGAKIPILIYHYDVLFEYPQNIQLFLYGKTILGGLAGGFIAVYFIKKFLRIEHLRMGNDIAAPAALGMAIGRIGCFFAGCCYGKEAPDWLGVDFGEGIYRFPTQLYEAAFDLILFAVLLYLKNKRQPKPGMLFTYLLSSYLSFRFLIEFIRVSENGILGLTYYQVICMVCLIIINRNVLLKITKRFFVRKEENINYGKQ